MTAVSPDTAHAARALWDINVHRLRGAGERGALGAARAAPHRAHRPLAHRAALVPHGARDRAGVLPPGRRPGRPGLLQQLCAQLDRQLGAGLREGAGLLFRTQLKVLAALTYVKWQELLPLAVPGTPW
uniref:Uncharacterized protein n=1 Tax=Nothoprocta perdicaria TaxID=30464 RepID=A0A8C6ZGS5_NOTPE